MRLRLFLAMTAILVATAGVTAVVSEHLGTGDGRTGEAQVIGDGQAPGTTATTAPPTSGPAAPPVGRVEVTGSVTGAHVEGARLDPADIRTPLTLSADPGFGNGAELTDVGVEGVRSTIVWDGGRPFVLSTGGALVLGAVTVDLVPDGLQVALGDGEHHFQPGTYRLDTPVAIGSSGVGQALDGVTFGADATSVLRASGDTSLLLDRTGSRHLTGSGALHLEGALRVTEAGVTRTVSSLDATGGSLDLTVTPGADGGWTIRLTVQGQVTTT